MPKFMLKIGPNDQNLINNEDICCYIADEKSAKAVLAQAISSDKLVLGTNKEFMQQFGLDGLLLTTEVDEKFAKSIKPLQKELKGKFLGVNCAPTRHEAMLASEAEPDFVCFLLEKENQEQGKAVIKWYSELFLIQQAIPYFEKIDEEILKIADFVILNASEYKILVDKIKRLD